MSKKRKCYIKYSIQINGEEYAREYTVTGIRNTTEAEAKLTKICQVPIIITSSEML